MAQTGDEDYKYFLLEKMVVISTQPRDLGEAPAVSTRHHPTSAAEPPKSLPEFCFPDLPRVLRGEAIKYSKAYYITLTNVDGERMFGFCKRVYHAPNYYLPSCICLLTYYPWFGAFEKLLEIIQMKWGSTDEINALIETACRYKPTHANESEFALAISPPGRSPIRYAFQRPPFDAAFGQPSFEMLLRSLSPSKILSVFGALHIFIPILSNNLLSYCCAPMPFLIGIHASLYDQVLKLPLEEVVFVNLDENKCTIDVDDEIVLPDAQLSGVRNAINSARLELANSPVGAKADKTQDMLIIEAVEKFFLDTVGQYKRYLHKGVNGEFTFNRKQFIKQSPRSVRLFLEALCASQMFEQFLAEREKRLAKGTPLTGSFERQVDELMTKRLPDNSALDALKSFASKYGDVFKAKMEDVKRGVVEFMTDEEWEPEGHQKKIGMRNSNLGRPARGASQQSVISTSGPRRVADPTRTNPNTPTRDGSTPTALLHANAAHSQHTRGQSMPVSMSREELAALRRESMMSPPASHSARQPNTSVRKPDAPAVSFDLIQLDPMSQSLPPTQPETFNADDTIITNRLSSLQPQESPRSAHVNDLLMGYSETLVDDLGDFNPRALPTPATTLAPVLTPQKIHSIPEPVFFLEPPPISSPVAFGHSGRPTTNPFLDQQTVLDPTLSGSTNPFLVQEPILKPGS